MASLYELRSEHQAVVEQLSEMKSAVAKCLAGQVIEALPELWRWDGFVEKALKPHFELEERTIIPILAKGPDKHRHLAAELQKEHTYLLGCFSRYTAALQHTQEESSSLQLSQLWQEISEKLLEHANLEHANKEDNLIIPLLREYFKLAEDEQITEHAPTLLYQEDL